MDTQGGSGISMFCRYDTMTSTVVYFSARRLLNSKPRPSRARLILEVSEESKDSRAIVSSRISRDAFMLTLMLGNWVKESLASSSASGARTILWTPCRKTWPLR